MPSLPSFILAKSFLPRTLRRLRFAIPTKTARCRRLECRSLRKDDCVEFTFIQTSS